MPRLSIVFAKVIVRSGGTGLAFLSARAIRYQRRGFRPQILLTSLLDPDAYPAHEIAELYHERWELELGFDEVQTHALERMETLRSKAPERVLQELWGLGIAYNSHVPGHHAQE